MALTAQILPADSATAATDSVATDSVVPDTVAHDTISYILLEAPEVPQLPLHEAAGGDSGGMSWILGAITLLFVIVAIRFRKNSKYLSAMFRDAVEVRERGNVFDETVREKSFMLMLNLLWCLSVGVLLYVLAAWSTADPAIAARFAATGFSAVPPGGYTSATAPAGMGICIGVALVWQIAMTAAYTVVGRVFSDAQHTRMWITGYLATTGLSTLIFFPLALLAIFYPDEAEIILCVAGFGYLAAKMIFIWKGFRIFFKDITSWLLFLYYLCSLEIVPSILLYLSTVLACGTFL